MEFETKVLSRQIQEALYNHNETLGTAESCTGGRIAEAIISVPGASQYFKGGVVSYGCCRSWWWHSRDSCGYNLARLWF